MGGIMDVTSAASAYADYTSAAQTTDETTTAAEASAATSTSTVAEDEAAESGVIYEKSDDSSTTSATYTINKMSAEDRAALVEKLKADQEEQKNKLIEMVQKMLSQQSSVFGNATGLFMVDEQTRLQAQQDISEDGYWGVEQTSQRLFDFASALAGDDVDKMKEMQEAMMKGYKLATNAWSGDLPSISQQTIDAANQKFEDYYASKENATVE